MPAQGNVGTGKLTSPVFVISQTYLSFLIGGGKETSLVALGVRLEVDGKVVRRSTGKNSDTMEWVNWDVAELMGKTGRIIIEDAATRSSFPALPCLIRSRFAMLGRSTPTEEISMAKTACPPRRSAPMTGPCR